jgi:hypothetical protein
MFIRQGAGIIAAAKAENAITPGTTHGGRRETITLQISARELFVTLFVTIERRSPSTIRNEEVR